MKTEFHKNYSDLIEGTISCFDRVMICGSLSKWGYADAMLHYLINNHIRIQDFPLFAKEENERVRQNVESIAKQNNIIIEHIRNPNHFDKEEHIQKILAERGDQIGLVHIYTSMEICDAYMATYDKVKRLGSLKPRTTKCLHYYIYFIDKTFGLCFLRIPTWVPFRLQFYFNGHNYLANIFKKRNIKFTVSDNAFLHIEDYQKAQKISDSIKAEDIHKFLDMLANKFLPFLERTGQNYRWTLTQSEYCTDIIFKNPNDLQPIYDQLALNCIHGVKPGNIATFFSRKLSASYEQNVCSNYNKLTQGTRVKHHMGVNSIKMYNKEKTILRVETTVNDPTQFWVYREVNTRDHQTVVRFAAMKKSIYSVHKLSSCCLAANSRYLDFISSFNNYSSGTKNLNKVTEKLRFQDRSYAGFNFFDPFDAQILLSLESGEFNINGFRNKTLRSRINRPLSSSAMSRILKRLLLHGIIKKAKNSYKYYLTKFGKVSLSGAHVVKELNIIPALAN